MTAITELHSWSALKVHTCQTTGIQHPHLHTENLELDLSHQQLDEKAFALLLAFAKERGLSEKITALFRGDAINISEKKPALHTALRISKGHPILINNTDITLLIMSVREAMWSISNKIRQGLWLGATNKPIRDIVNIGIGGSDLGPRFCVDALKEYCLPDLQYHFISDGDPNSFENVTASLNPETTLFIIASKSFTTQETLYNANKAFAFIGKHQAERHFIAVTANEVRARALGISTTLPIWDWVGGRYSLCSAINLITCIAIGYERFSELLAGAHSMDRHFQHTVLENNLPVVLALVGLWNINFLDIPSLLMLVYGRQLGQFIAYVQQLDMESNGKSVDTLGQKISYKTAPIVWGGLGNQAQHSYFQLLAQGTHRVACDFISIKTFEEEMINTLCHAKIRVLSQGITASPEASIPGGMPINHLKITEITPLCLGELIALYEHKIYVQGVLWGINSFDQPGVESAKRLVVLKP